MCPLRTIRVIVQRLVGWRILRAPAEGAADAVHRAVAGRGGGKREEKVYENSGDMITRDRLHEWWTGATFRCKEASCVRHDRTRHVLDGA